MLVLLERMCEFYFFILEGSANINETMLEKRDGLGVEDADNLSIKSKEASEVLIMEVPLIQS